MKTLLLALSLAAAVQAASIPLFNTGTDASNNPLGLADNPSKLNQNEIHFSLVSGTGAANAFLTRWQLPYFSEAGLDARWISPAIVQAGAAPSFPSEVASYRLVQTFDMSPFDISTAWLSGLMGADNCMVITLNTTVLPTTHGTCGGSSPSTNFLSLTSFSASASAFVPGINTLTIDYYNQGGPGALIITDLQGTADPAVPEPSTYALIGTSLLAIQFLRRKR